MFARKSFAIAATMSLESSSIAARSLAMTFLAAIVSASPAAAQSSTGWTYQGQLQSGGQPATGNFAMTFTLWNAATDGAAVSSTLVFNGQPGNPAPVQVTSGLFSVVLDWTTQTPAAFNGGPRWLEITVDGNTLAPRQPVTPAPYALFSSAPWATVGSDISYTGGKVGIGGTPSAARLDVTGGIRASANHSTHPQGAHLEWNKTDGDGATWLLNQKGLGPGGMILGEVDGANIVSKRIVINGDGRIGIGGPPVNFGLVDIRGSARVQDVLNFGDDNANSDPVSISRSNVGSDYTRLIFNVGDNPGSGPGPGDEILFNAGGSTQFIFRSNGEAYKTGFPGWGTISDARAKHDIEPLTGSLDRLLKLQGHTFFYNDPESLGRRPGKCIGFVAQEVETVFPEWVGTFDMNTKSLTITGFEALAVEALRDLRTEKDAQIGTLQSESASLRAENAALRERLNAIERVVTELANRKLVPANKHD